VNFDINAEDVMLPVLRVIKRKVTCHDEKFTSEHLQMRFSIKGAAGKHQCKASRSSIL